LIRARGKLRGRETIVLGLDGGTVRRLMNNEPIMFDGVQVGVPGVKIVILAGETLNDVKEDLRAIGMPVPRDDT
jgi:hypothetical protein